MTKDKSKVTTSTKVMSSTASTVPVISKKKTVVIYKSDKKVTIRKPRKGDVFVSFNVEIDEKPVKGSAKKDDVATLAKVKNFVKHIVTDVKELNFLKNDIGFLMSEIYGPDHSTDTNVNVYNGRVFYIWVHLPYMKTAGSRLTLPKNIQKDVFPYDLFYIRQDISDADCKNILNLLRRDIDAFVYVRDLQEFPDLPFNVCSI